VSGSQRGKKKVGDVRGGNSRTWESIVGKFVTKGSGQGRFSLWFESRGKKKGKLGKTFVLRSGRSGKEASRLGGECH